MSVVTPRICDEGSAALTPAQRSEDVDLIVRTNGMAKVAREHAAHEEVHVRADALLLIDHAEADAGIAPLQVGHHFDQRLSLRLDLSSPIRVGSDVGRKMYSHGHRRN